MQPLKLTIQGRFWDSQLYSGRLYLFDMDGSVRVIDWDKMLGEWPIERKFRLPFECAFLQSEYLYGDRWKLLFSDSDVKKLIRSKFEQLAESDDALVVSAKKLETYQLSREESPFPFPHSDVTIYSKMFYGVSPEGLFRAKCNIDARRKPIGKGKQIADMPAFALAASLGTLALAAGDNGLFEVPITETDFDGRFASIEEIEEPRPIAKQNCVDCNWAYHSIYGSSHIESGYLAAFKREGSNPGGSPRKFDRLLQENAIFQGRGYSWGAQDKLCQARDNAVHIVKYNPFDTENNNEIRNLGRIQLEHWKGGVVSGGSALFGVIVECDHCLIVVPSDGPTITIPGEPVNWRVFPRSKYYENHLHIVWEDRIDILSFNHDYFVAQSEKVVGIPHYDAPTWRRR